MVEHAGNSAKRIRIGLTGLAFAFVIVMLGSAISRSGDDNGNMVNEPVASAPNEPLAELGVAPGAGDEEANGSNAVQP